jgi:hypothetical protein
MNNITHTRLDLLNDVAKVFETEADKLRLLTAELVVLGGYLDLFSTIRPDFWPLEMAEMMLFWLAWAYNLLAMSSGCITIYPYVVEIDEWPIYIAISAILSPERCKLVALVFLKSWLLTVRPCFLKK